jgi:hypothetical protein
MRRRSEAIGTREDTRIEDLLPLPHTEGPWVFSSPGRYPGRYLYLALLTASTRSSTRSRFPPQIFRICSSV